MSDLASLDLISVTSDPMRLDLMPRVGEIESNEAGSEINRSDIDEAGSDEAGSNIGEIGSAKVDLTLLQM